MPEKEPVAGLASSSASQAIALEETDSLRELLVQLIDERLGAVHAGLAEALRVRPSKEGRRHRPAGSGPDDLDKGRGRREVM